MQATGLVASDLQPPSTYESDISLACSLVDHVFSFEASSFIKHVVTLHSDANLSDHLPLLVSIDCRTSSLQIKLRRLKCTEQ